MDIQLRVVSQERLKHLGNRVYSKSKNKQTPQMQKRKTLLKTTGCLIHQTSELKTIRDSTVWGVTVYNSESWNITYEKKWIKNE